MSTSTVRTILVPGAWMGAWIWEPTARRLADHGLDAEAITLRGLEPAHPKDAVAAVRLDDHVRQLVDHIVALGTEPVVLVSHSYSTMPTALAADRLGGQVRGLVHMGGFPPVDGRSMLDDWGTSPEDRDQERADIAAAADLWMPPDRPMLDGEPDLTSEDRDFLAARFTPHPGRTVTDPARLSSPVATQPSTYVTLSTDDDEDEAWKDAPRPAREATTWRRKHLRSGHWPMISAPEATADLIAEEITFYRSGAI